MWDVSRFQEIASVCRARVLRFHLDGARVFNALVESGDVPAEYGTLFDSISLCLSKGLGAPIGSVLLSSATNIKQARRLRKVFGGGMRQAGMLAAAGIYALDHHIDRLKEDHVRARELGALLMKRSEVEEVLPIDTNIVVARLQTGVEQVGFLKALEERGIKAVPFGPGTIRMVTHLDFSDEDLEQVAETLKQMSSLNPSV